MSEKSTEQLFSEISEVVNAKAKKTTSQLQLEKISSGGKIGLLTADYVGRTSSANGHEHEFYINVGHDGRLSGYTSFDDGHEHIISGELRWPQVECAPDSNNVYHSHVVPVPQRVNLAPDHA